MAWRRRLTRSLSFWARGRCPRDNRASLVFGAADGLGVSAVARRQALRGEGERELRLGGRLPFASLASGEFISCPTAALGRLPPFWSAAFALLTRCLRLLLHGQSRSRLARVATPSYASFTQPGPGREGAHMPVLFPRVTTANPSPPAFLHCHSLCYSVCPCGPPPALPCEHNAPPHPTHNPTPHSPI